MTVLLGLYLFCAWVSWKNLSHINAVVHPQTIPAFVTMIVLSMLTVFTAITKGDIELWATFQVFAILPVLGAILAILSLRRQTVGGLNLNLRDFLTRGFSRVPGPRLPPASKAKATLFLIAGFLWFFGLAFVRNYAEAQHQMQVFGLAIAAGFMFLIRARHNLQPDFQTVVSDDPRPPILFLRSFADDKNVTEGSHAENIFNNLGFIGYGFFDFSLESRLAAHFSEFGPFIAVGQPKDKSPHLGAIRAHLSEDEWRASVLRWFAASRLVLMLLGTTKWVSWELQTLIDLGHARKTLLIFPPLSTGPSRKLSGRAERMNSLSIILGETAWASTLSNLQENHEAEHIRAIVFEPEGGLTAVISRPDNRDSYHFAALVAQYFAEKNLNDNVGPSDATSSVEPDEDLASFPARAVAVILDTAVVLACCAVLKSILPFKIPVAEAVIGLLIFDYLFLDMGSVERSHTGNNHCQCFSPLEVRGADRVASVGGTEPDSLCGCRADLSGGVCVCAGILITAAPRRPRGRDVGYTRLAD
jgi:hypothetical protein